MSPILQGVVASQISGHLTPADSGAMFPLGMVQVGSAGASTISFTSIPSTYKHLQIRALFGTGGAGSVYIINFNSDTGNNYSYHYVNGNGASVTTGASTSRAFTVVTDNSGAGVTTSPTAAIIDILDYTSTAKNKTIRSLVGYDGNGSGDIRLASGLYFATPAAITSVTFSREGSSTLAQNSKFALSGIKGPELGT